MKGVILAGGLGTRLYPGTHATNKHLLLVYDRPMVYYPIQTLVSAGVNEILIVTGGPHAGDFLGVLRNGKQLGIKHLEYAYQEGEGGIAAALSLAEDFADRGNICVILGDNCTDADISKDVSDFREGAKIFLKEVPDPKRFGVAEIDGKKILSIEEKPESPKSSLAVTGLYLYDKTVFDRIRKLEPSGRNELEVTDLNKSYLEEGGLTWSYLDGYWRDAGTFETLYEASKYWAEKELRSKERE